MNCRDWRTRYGDWRREHPQEMTPADLVAHLKECPRCRLAGEALAVLDRPERLKTDTPPFLAREVMARIVERGSLPRYQRLLTLKWVLPLVTTAALAVLLIVTQIGVPTAPQHVSVNLRLAAPQARSVAVVGDWNAWQPGIDQLSDRDGDGVWELEITLKKNNEYRYQFIINEESWIPDPLAPLQTEDGFGGTNSVLDI